MFDGSKSLSVREFPLPEECANTPICLLARADPPASEPLADSLPAGAGGFRVAGIINFSGGADPYAGRAGKVVVDDVDNHATATTTTTTKSTTTDVTATTSATTLTIVLSEN